ncbi:hypothetical protein ACRRTK_022803 [Alexandromys fortis]
MTEIKSYGNPECPLCLGGWSLLGAQEVSLPPASWLCGLGDCPYSSSQNQSHSQICNPSQRFKIFKLFMS